MKHWKKQKKEGIHISTKMIHLSAKIISRGGEKPQSAVASAAYRSGTKIYCEYDGEIKDFSRKGHVIYSEILLPEYAPKEFADRSVLWNAVENFEKGSRAQLSRGIDLLPTIHMGAAVTAMERRGIKTEIGNMNREIKKINDLIISSMENIERITDKIAFLEKEKKSARRDKE